MKLNKMCIFVPTRNNPELISYFIKTVNNDLKQYNVDLYFYDTSSDLKTRSIVEYYSSKNIYYFLDHKYSDVTTDLKIVNGFTYLMNKYSYIWLCGDGYVPIIGDVIPKIRPYLESDYDLIHFIEKKYIDNKEYILLNNIDFFKTCGWNVPLYGATILSSNLMKNIDFSLIYKDFKNSGFLYFHAIFASLDTTNKIAAINRVDTFITNPYKKTSTSYRPKSFSKFWFQSWPKAVFALPECYSPYKVSVCRMLGQNSDFFTLKSILVLRATKNLSYKIIKENKKNILKVTDVPLSKFYLVASIPIPILRFFRFCFKALKSTFRRLK